MVGPITMSKLRCFLDFTSWDRGIGWLGQVSPQQCTMISKSARKKPNANDVRMLYVFMCVQPLIFIYGMIPLNKYIKVAYIWRAFPVFSGYMWLYNHNYWGCFHGYTHCSPQLDPQQYQTFTSCQVKPRTYS